jgi:serine/threonine protein kinase
VFRVLKGVLCGFIFPLGVTVAHELPAHFSYKDKLQASSIPSPKEQLEIDALTRLVFRLHTQGVIHGDIKPSNIIFCKETSRVILAPRLSRTARRE